ncbi:MAG: hypothetical protein R6U57_00535 [Anaerolineales bacterium]
MEKRFKVLRTIGNIYKILGIVAAVITILAALGICAMSFLGSAALARYTQDFGNMPLPYLPRAGGVLAGVIGAIISILYGGMIAISFYGLGEGVELLIAMEENTRKSAQLLDQMGSTTE